MLVSQKCEGSRGSLWVVTFEYHLPFFLCLFLEMCCPWTAGRGECSLALQTSETRAPGHSSLQMLSFSWLIFFFLRFFQLSFV